MDPDLNCIQPQGVDLSKQRSGIKYVTQFNKLKKCSKVTAVVCKSTTRKRLGSEPAHTRKSFVAYLPQYNYRKKVITVSYICLQFQ